MAEHNAPITHIAFQRADGTTGVLDIHDESSMHDAPDVVKAENITDGAVGNGKIAPKSVTEAELADGSVTTAVIADGAVTIGKLSPEMQESWDSISQGSQIAYEDVIIQVNPVTNVNASSKQPNVVVLPVRQTTPSNFIARQMIKVWPKTAWNNSDGEQAIVTMSCPSDALSYNRACFTSNMSQVYDIYVRFWYRP